LKIGGIVKHIRVEKQLQKAMTELGLTPVTRSKAARDKPEKADAFAKFDGLTVVQTSVPGD
jgi:phage terminase small subunit